jgi:hypothetical protein
MRRTTYVARRGGFEVACILCFRANGQAICIAQRARYSMQMILRAKGPTVGLLTSPTKANCRAVGPIHSFA